MSGVVRLPANLIGKEDREHLESFGGHSIARGRATRWHWASDDRGNDTFEIYKGGADERLAFRVSRDRRKDAFCVRDSNGNKVLEGSLEHIMAGLEEALAVAHGEFTG